MPANQFLIAGTARSYKTRYSNVSAVDYSGEISVLSRSFFSSSRPRSFHTATSECFGGAGEK